MHSRYFLHSLAVYAVPQVGVNTVHAKKLGVGASLRDALVSYNEYLVSILYRGKSVCYHDGGSSAAQLLKALLDRDLRCIVKC